MQQYSLSLTIMYSLYKEVRKQMPISGSIHSKFCGRITLIPDHYRMGIFNTINYFSYIMH